MILGFFAGEIRGEKLLGVERHLRECGACQRLIAVAGAQLRSIGGHDWDVAAMLEGETEASVLLRSLRIVSDTDYVVERELARGGMGRVLLATDRQGRTVALKVLLGSSEAGMRRFLREMQITARLQHPSITALYEAGRWPSGEPFFAMKLVQGRTLREELAERAVLRDRLALVPRVIAVTDALAYAHEQGIIHRDLKPGNILVGAFGETVVIDWGLAKARGGTGGDASEPSGILSPPSSHDTTEFGTPIGTPAYMAPEQARGEALDERADVYGLGALLYHVLSGRPPYIGPSAREVLAQVQSGPPSSLAKLMPELPSDLVAIVAKAMMPDAGQRYPSAQTMAEDLRRFAAGQLVRAHVYSARALVRRWARKNRALVSVAAGLLTLGILAGWASINRIVDARNRAEIEQANATAHHVAAENLVNFLMTEFHDRAVRADRLELLEGLGQQVSRYYRSIDESAVPLDTTSSSHRAMTLQVLAGVELDRRNLGEARVLFQRALEFWQSADRGVDTPADELQQYGKAWQYYASLEDLEGNVDAALGAYQKAIDLADRMVSGHPGDLDGHLLAAANLGWMCETLRSGKGDLSASFEACNRGIVRLEPLLSAHPHEAKLSSRLAFLYQLASDRHLGLGHLDEAAAAIRRSSELYLRVVDSDPNDLRAAREYAYTFIYSGAVEIARGRLDAAMAAIDANVQRYEAIVRDEPENLANADDLAVGYAYKCDFERRAARLDRAETACRKAIALLGHEGQPPENAARMGLLALALTNLGRVELAAHRYAAASQTLSTAAALSRRPSASDPASGTGKEQLLASLTWRVDCELKLGRPAEANEHAVEALDLASDLARQSPENSEMQTALGWAQTMAGNVALAQRRFREAASAYGEARQTFERLLRRSPRVVDFQTGLARACAREADALDAAQGAVPSRAQQLRHVAQSILDELRQEGRLYPEDAALSTSLDARAPRLRH